MQLSHEPKPLPHSGWKPMIVFVMLMSVAASSPGKDGIKLSDSKEEIAEFLWEKTASNIENIHSGVDRAKGAFVIRKEHERLDSDSEENLIKDRFNEEFGWKRETVRELKFFSAFDFPQGFYRIARTEPARVPRRREPCPDDPKWSTCQWVLTPEKSISVYPYTAGSPRKHVYIRGSAFRGPCGKVYKVGVDDGAITVANRNAPTVIQPFLDVRSLPLNSYNGMKRLDCTFGQPAIIRR